MSYCLNSSTPQRGSYIEDDIGESILGVYSGIPGA